ncbi:D,D-heptose 1,7-bisphosphate phosphatase [Candidatus Methylobacter favarea]|uniref:D,D-heptose 1,7-bisphosphate phosphatase n=1 Tax=Candidatus Methylobacter favarea TaxID=2707345 RepID=A0A8S0XJ27_9GAMM|nr:HAD family hydrolase [Candidatus Methylobacter favarea]CAA9892863.1 D,D-heptose 1,7-bisphosphate phosphatase [Candidatus Methylobacter favarea]
MAITRKKAVFIDKDGTLIHDVPYNIDPHHIRLMEDAGHSLYRLKKAGYQLIVISNQAGIARGLFNKSDLLPVNRQIQLLLAPYAVNIDAFYYCPHGPDDGCDCRKPKQGMILRAAEDHAVELPVSWMIGDILHDVEAGNRAGCRTVLFDNGNETEWLKGDWRQPRYSVKNLTAAADIICDYERGRRAYERQVSGYH